MARPRSPDPGDVIHTAMTVFWRRGLAAASMADIYAATGLKPGHLYATFTDKETLFRLAFDAYATQFRARLPQRAQGLAAIAEWLRVQVRLGTDDPERKGCLIANTFTEREAQSAETRALTDERLAEITAFFRHHLGLAQAAGDLDAVADLERLVASLTEVVVAIMSLARGGASAATLHDIAEHAVATLLPSAAA